MKQPDALEAKFNLNNLNPESTLFMVYIFWPLISFGIFFLFLNLTNSLIVIKFECIDGLQKLCQQRDDHENMRYVYKWIIQREV